ncbi:MAG: hypothetical protein DIU80_001970 [Chloroflexota bacterium]
MARHSPQPVWRALATQALLGALSGAAAAAAAWLAFRGMYAVSFALADRLDGWLAFAAIAVLLIVTTLLSGAAGGLAGALVSGIVVRRLWCPSRRWLALWALAWALGGLALWLGIVQASRGDPALDLSGVLLWALLGLLISTGFAALAPPWRPAPPRA